MKTETEVSGRVTLDLTRQPDLPSDYKTLKAFAEEFNVETAQDFEVATELIQKSAKWMASVEAFFKDGRERALAAHRWFTGTIKTLTAPYDIRGVLEPKMKRYLKGVEERRLAEECRIQQEQAKAEQAARAEAERIRVEAELAAAELRKQGQMGASRQMVEAAAEQAQNVVEQAQAIADVGTILPAPARVEGVSDSRPWIAEVVDLKAICKAIGDGVIPLEFLTPVRGQGEAMVPLVSVNMSVLNHIAKRMGRENLNIPGTRGIREVQLRFSKSAAAAPVPRSGDEW
jgi:hypothetical protein